MTNVFSKITFIKKQKIKPYYDSSAITGMIPKLYFKTEKKNVLIKNARTFKKSVLDKNGFELYDYKSKYSKNNINENLENYKKEVADFLKSIIPYEKIFVFDLTRRSNDTKGAYNPDGQRQPADRAHVDYTIKSGPKRAKDIIGHNEYKDVISNNKRIIQLNVWKPLSEVVLSSPLAFADTRSIKHRDLVATDQYFPDRKGEIYHLAYDPDQSWYWIPEMKFSEVLLLKGWDSIKKKKISKFTPHSSFNIKNQNIKKFPRESIEARIFLLI